MTSHELFFKMLKYNTSILQHPKRILILTHTDLDGAGVAVVIHTLYPESHIVIDHLDNGVMSETILKAVEYNHKEHDFDLIIVGDISLNQNDALVVDEILKQDDAFTLLLFDHHLTAEHLNIYDWACVYGGDIPDSLRAKFYHEDLAEMHTSGTALVYDFFSYMLPDLKPLRSQLCEFTHIVSIYDTWDWKTANTDLENYANKFNSLCHIYGLKLFIDVMCVRIFQDDDWLTPHEDRLLEVRQKDTWDYIHERVAKSIQTEPIRINNHDYSIAYCIATNHLAEIFEYMRGYIEADIFAIITGDSVSLRTNREDIDLSEIAKLYNGGGHKAAAGFSLTAQARKQLLLAAFDPDSQDKTNYFS